MANEHEHELEHEEEQFITLVDENGNEQLHEVLFTFDSDEFEKSYVFFYPVGSFDDDEEDVDIHVYAYIPTDDGGYGPLMQIETDEEWDMVEEVFNTFNEDQEAEEE
jgi:uncharacterized protein YrzB (UPF0473 family)